MVYTSAVFVIWKTFPELRADNVGFRAWKEPVYRGYWYEIGCQKNGAVTEWERTPLGFRESPLIPNAKARVTVVFRPLRNFIQTSTMGYGFENDQIVRWEGFRPLKLHISDLSSSTERCHIVWRKTKSWFSLVSCSDCLSNIRRKNFRSVSIIVL